MHVEQVHAAVPEGSDERVASMPVGTGPASTERAHGRLPVLLVGLTIVTGLVDAFSYLGLGQVFVANMTGNVVFVGFGLVGMGGTSLASSLVAVLAFALGAAAAGRWAVRHVPHRGRLLAVVASVQALLVVSAAVLAGTVGIGNQPIRSILVALLAVAMGMQNAVARRLAVPDLTTTVLTLTVTGLVADATSGRVRLRRAVAVLAMLGGALAGGALLAGLGPSAPLWTAAAMLAVIALCSADADRDRARLRQGVAGKSTAGRHASPVQSLIVRVSSRAAARTSA